MAQGSRLPCTASPGPTPRPGRPSVKVWAYSVQSRWRPPLPSAQCQASRTCPMSRCPASLSPTYPMSASPARSPGPSSPCLPCLLVSVFRPSLLSSPLTIPDLASCPCPMLHQFQTSYTHLGKKTLISFLCSTDVNSYLIHTYSLESDPVYRAQLERLAAASLSSSAQAGLLSPYSLLPHPRGQSGLASVPRPDASKSAHAQSKHLSGNANAPPPLVPGREGPVSSVSILVVRPVMVALVINTLLPGNSAVLNIINSIILT